MNNSDNGRPLLLRFHPMRLDQKYQARDFLSETINTTPNAAIATPA
jgi:hypothetical protein